MKTKLRLGFLALSGVRVVDPELMAIGVNLPGFVERSKVIASLPSLGLLTLAGMTPPHIDVRYVEVPDVAAWETLPGPFDAVALSSLSATIKDAYALAARYRAAGVIVIMGGLHVTACADEAALHADAVIIGEGEPVWPEVMRDLERGALRKRYDARTRPFDLAEAPMPRFDLLDTSRYNRITVQTQRGCPWNCEFCAASIRLSPRFKTKPVAKVVAELKRVREVWPHPFIEFADDNTFADKRRGRELMRALAPLGLRWFTETDISVADDPELLRMIRDAGCAQLLVGLEAPDDAGLAGLELRANWKLRRRDSYLRAIERIQDAGITVNGCLVLGLDPHGAESFDRVWDFVRESGLYEVQITVMTAFPGTPLYARLQREGRLIAPEAWETCTLFDVNFQPARMSVAELRAGLMDLGRKIYSAEFTEQRRRRFFRRQLDLRNTREGAGPVARAGNG
jgi:radical SAM superfamily enzyme YgiQ (UPF0313 family)